MESQSCAAPDVREVVEVAGGTGAVDGGSDQSAARPQRSRILAYAVTAALALAALLAAFVHDGSPASAQMQAGGEAQHRFLQAVNASSLRNPFANQVFYKNPTNQDQFDESIRTSNGLVAENLRAMRDVPSAYWIDVKSKIRGTSLRSLEGILADASSKSPAEMVVFIWYDLPNRDCHAKASNGEICCKYLPDGRCDYNRQQDCTAGLKEYRETYADPFVEVLKKYQDKVPVAVVVEPDSLPNLATNAHDRRCGGAATRQAYTEGVRYAVEQLTTETPNVAVYLDAAHGGWLGWQDNLQKFLRMLGGMRLPVSKMRGFATNVANYQPLGKLCPHQPDSGTRNGYCLNWRHQWDDCCADPCGLAAEWNPGNNELNYAQELVIAARSVLRMDAHVIIDTGRNGVTNMRQDCANWCNARGAGAGVASTAQTDAPTFVDAYYWLKTPGESDGCTAVLPNGDACPRFDADCASPDSLGSGYGEPRAPEAGHWFDYQVKQLAEFAHLG
jgi:cellulose 1,4-beta-cellobiosidase